MKMLASEKIFSSGDLDCYSPSNFIKIILIFKTVSHLFLFASMVSGTLTVFSGYFCCQIRYHYFKIFCQSHIAPYIKRYILHF